MQFITKIINTFALFPRLFLLTDLRHDLTRNDFLRLSLSLSLGGLSSGAKIVAPAAFGRTIEMIAKGEMESNILGLNWTPLQLLLLSTCLSVWLRAEQNVQKKFLLPIKTSVSTKLSKRLSEYAHKITMRDHMEKSQQFNTGFSLIQNSCSQLPIDVVSVIYPSILDLGLGLGIIGSNYGKNMVLGFLSYSLFDSLLVNSALSLFLKNNARFQRLNNASLDFYYHENENIHYEETVRINNREKFEITRTENYLRLLTEATQAHSRGESFISLCRILPDFIISLLMIFYIYKDDLALDQLDELVFLITYFSIFSVNLNSFGSTLKVCYSALNSFSTVNSIINKASSDLSADIEPINLICDLPIYQQINLDVLTCPITVQFKNVFFGYSENHYVLRNINFSVAPGEILAITGPSGIGKSTIAKLLYGLYKPTSGQINFNGVNIQSIPVQKLRNLVGFIPQSTDIFCNESLKYNVLYGIEKEELLQAVSSSYIVEESKDTMEAKPLLSTTIVEEAEQVYRNVMKEVNLEYLVKKEESGEKISPSTLSGGEKQRVSLARALVRHSKIFVTDEVTAALDSFHEKKLLDTITTKTKNKTAIMISHRLSTIKRAQKILVLDEGKISEEGTHDELIAKEGLYKSYWQAQC